MKQGKRMGGRTKFEKERGLYKKGGLGTLCQLCISVT